MELGYCVVVLPFLAGESYLREAPAANSNAVSNRKAAMAMLGYAISSWVAGTLVTRCGALLDRSVPHHHISFFLSAIALAFVIIVANTERVL